MPIPAAADGGRVANVILALFSQLHEEFREEIEGLDDDAVNWVPVEGSNSVATIVTHVVGSEAETLRTLMGQPADRDRDAEFSGGSATTAGLLAFLDQADQLVATVRTRLDDERLGATLALPTLPAEETRSGLTWLVGNYGHAREHLGHVQLTRQLYENDVDPGPSSGSG